MYFRVWQYTVTPLLGVVTSAAQHTSDLVRGSADFKLSTREGTKTLLFNLALTSLLSPYLTEKGYGVSEISLTNGTDVACLAALLTACPHSITLHETQKKKEWNLKRIKLNSSLNSRNVEHIQYVCVWILPGSCRAWPRPYVWQTHVHRCRRTAKQ